MEVTSRRQDATFLCISVKVIHVEFFASLILLAVHGGKIHMGPLPGKFITIPVALNFLGIALTVDMGIFWRVAIFL